MQVTAFKDRSNIEQYLIYDTANAPFDLIAAGVNKVEVIAGDTVIDSDSENVTIETTQVSYNSVDTNITKLSVKYGALPADTGQYSIKVVAYTTADTLGQVLFGPGMQQSVILDLMEN